MAIANAHFVDERHVPIPDPTLWSRLRDFWRVTMEVDTRPGDKTGTPLVPQSLLQNNPILVAVLAGGAVFLMQGYLGQLNKTPADLATMSATISQLTKNQDQFTTSLNTMQVQVNQTAIEAGKIQILMTELSRRADAVATELRALRQGLGSSGRQNQGYEEDPDRDPFPPSIKPQSLRRADVQRAPIVQAAQ